MTKLYNVYIVFEDGRSSHDLVLMGENLPINDALALGNEKYEDADDPLMCFVVDSLVAEMGLYLLAADLDTFERTPFIVDLEDGKLVITVSSAHLGCEMLEERTAARLEASGFDVPTGLCLSKRVRASISMESICEQLATLYDGAYRFKIMPTVAMNNDAPTDTARGEAAAKVHTAINEYHALNEEYGEEE